MNWKWFTVALLLFSISFAYTILDMGNYYLVEETGMIIHKGPPPFIGKTIIANYSPVSGSTEFYGYAGIGGGFGSIQEISGYNIYVDEVWVTMWIKTGYENIVRCTMVDFDTDSPAVEPLKLWFYNTNDDYFCPGTGYPTRTSCIVGEVHTINGVTEDGLEPYVSPDHTLTIVYDPEPDIQAPVGACGVYFTLPSTMSYLWKCEFTDGSVEYYTEGGYSGYDEYDWCVPGYLSDEYCIDRTHLGRDYVGTDGIVTQKVTYDCTDKHPQAYCDSSINSCRCPSTYIGDPFCDPSDPTKVFQKRLYSDCSEKTEVVEDCSQYDPSGRCQNGDCVCTEKWIGNPFCKPDDPNNVYSVKLLSDCTTTEAIYQTCSPGETCINGACVATGGGEWISAPYCKPEDPYHVYRLWKNPDGSTEEKIYQTCAQNQVCKNGECVTIPEGGEGGIPVELAVTIVVVLLIVLVYLFMRVRKS